METQNQATGKRTVIDMTKRVHRELKHNTRIGESISKVLGEKSYLTTDGTLEIKLPLYGLKGQEDDPIDAVELNYHLVANLIQKSGDFKQYVKDRKSSNALVQKVQEYSEGRLEIPDFKTALLNHLMPIYTNKDHIIKVELYPDDNDNDDLDWAEVKFGKVLNLSASVIDQQMIMPLLSKFDLFGGGSAAKGALEAGAQTLKLG